MMENAELEAFKAIVDYGSVTQAALKLNRVQSSISFRIKTLESKLGTRLFERSGRRIVVTAAGNELYGYASQILEWVAKAEASFGQGSGPQKLRLGVIENFTLSRQPLLQRIMSNPIALDIDITLGNSTYLIDALESGICDAAIVGAGIAPGHLTRLGLFEDRLTLIYGESHAPVSLDTLDGCSFLVNSRQSASQRNLKELLTLHRATPDRIVECGSYSLLFSQVANGAGVSLVPQALVEVFAPTHKVLSLELTGPYATFNTEMVFLDASLGSAARRLTEWILESEPCEVRSTVGPRVEMSHG